MKALFLRVILMLHILSSCQTTGESSTKEEYLRWVGDIEQDSQMDEQGFVVCHGDANILQYFNLGKGPVYEGEKSKLINTFKSKYKPVSGGDESGWIRIRFVVNCDGKAGRFRVLQSDYHYQEKEFKQEITSQLTDITKALEQWPILYKDQAPVDYYMYLIFKIDDGQLTEILP